MADEQQNERGNVCVQRQPSVADTPLPLEHIRRIVETLGNDPLDLRYRALLFTGFAVTAQNPTETLTVKLSK